MVSYQLAYALGGTIHDGSRTVETDLAINALVQAPSGYVVADRQGRVHTVVDGESQQVGRLGGPRPGAGWCPTTTSSPGSTQPMRAP